MTSCNPPAHSVNPYDAPEGYVARPYEQAGGCPACVFNDDAFCANEKANCLRDMRIDEQAVIFQRKGVQVYVQAARGCPSCIFLPSPACSSCCYYQPGEEV